MKERSQVHRIQCQVRNVIMYEKQFEILGQLVQADPLQL